MEIKTPCTDDAIIVLDNFRLVASFRGVVAQGFGPLGYWKESDFDDEDSRRLMVGDFFQFRDIYIEQESRLKNNVYDKVLEINEELQGLLYNSVNSVVALRLKANQFRKCVMSNFETEIWSVNKYNQYLFSLKKHDIIGNDSLNEVASLMDSIGMLYMNSVNVINHSINELFEAIGDKTMCIPSLFFSKEKDDTLPFLVGDEEQAEENKQPINKRGRRPKFDGLKENTLEAFIEYSTGSRNNVDAYVKKIVQQLEHCTTGEDLAALTIALEYCKIIKCVDNGGVRLFWKMLHDRCDTIVGYEAMNDSYRGLVSFHKNGNVSPEFATGRKNISEYIDMFQEMNNQSGE